MIGYRYRATVVRWIDGDTVDLTVDLGFTVRVLQRFRLAGVNTPERGQSGWQAAIDACVAYAAPGAEVEVASTKTDKYGRYLGRITATGKTATINDELVRLQLAVPYMVDRA